MRCSCPGDATVRETLAPYRDATLPGGYRKRRHDAYNRGLCLLPGLFLESENKPLLSNASSEKEAVIDFLDRRADMLAATIRDGLDGLKEFRAALVSAAVTGKIDVRGDLGTEGTEV